MAQDLAAEQLGLGDVIDEGPCEGEGPESRVTRKPGARPFFEIAVADRDPGRDGRLFERIAAEFVEREMGVRAAVDRPLQEGRQALTATSSP